MTIYWMRPAAEDLARLLADQPSLDAQREFLALTRYATAGLSEQIPSRRTMHVTGVEEFGVPRWPFLLAYRREGHDILILRLLPLYPRHDAG